MFKKLEMRKPLDFNWFERYKNITNSFQTYECLTGKKEYRDNQKQLFFSGEIENPELDYPELEFFDFESKERDLLELKKEILEKEENEVVRKTYQWKINEKIAEVRMLKSVKNKDDRRFARYSNFVYGQPEKSVYKYTADKIKEKLEVLDVSSFSDERKNAITKTKQNLQADFKIDNHIPEFVKLNPNISGEESKKELSAEEIKISFKEALKKYGISGFNVVINDKFTAINVGYSEKEIRIPSNRKVSFLKLQGLIAHEIGTHARRFDSGQRSKLKLLSLGLDRYKDDEGVSTYEEQKVVGASDYSGLINHLAISLACGVDGQKRDFKEVYEILYDYNLAIGQKEDKAKDSAYSTCIRTFRGTTCKTKGACFTKDIFYRESNIETWDLVSKNSNEIRRFMVGKYDPSNHRHIWILDQLGITEDDLKNLEQEI